MADLYGNIPISSDIKKPAEKQHKKADPRDQPPSPRKPGKRLFWILPLVLLLLFAGYYGLSSVLVPYLIKDKFPEIFQRNTGLSLSVDTAGFNPLDCSITAEGIHINNSLEEDGSSEDFLTIRKLHVDLEFIQLLRRSIVSDALIINGAAFTVYRYPDNTYNISRFFKKSGGEALDMLDFAELPFLYSLNNISINNSSIVFNDTSTEKVHYIEDLKINLPTLSNFSIDIGNYIQPRFSAVINGSPVELVSETEQASRGGAKDITRLSGTLQAIDLQLYANYFPVPLPLVIEKGTADGKIQISFQAQEKEGGQLTLNYQFQVREALFRSHDRMLSLAVPGFNLLGSLNPLNSEIDITHLLLRDPTLKVEKGFSATTVDSLFLKDYDKNASSSFPLELPAITSALLIADNGTIVIETSGEDREFSHVQLSIRNFANAAALKGKASQGTFRVSAESGNDPAHYSWRGKFDNTTPVGSLEINNLPLAEVVKVIARKSGITGATATSATGSADIRGRFSLRRSESTPVSFDFDKGTLLFSSIRLAEDGKAWLQSPTGRATPVSITGEAISLGNLFFNDSTVTLSRSKLPALMQDYIDSEKGSIQGIDLKGSLTILPEKDTEKPVQLKNVHLQAADFEAAAKKENFVFSGSAENNGEISAKGKITTTPLSGTVEVAFTNLPAAVLPDRAASSYSVAARTLLNGTGKFDIDTQSYEGTLEIYDGLFTEKESGREYSFEKAAFAKVSADINLSDYRAEKLLFTNFAVEDSDLRFFSESASISTISRQGEDFHIEGLALPQAKIGMTPNFLATLPPFPEKESGNILIENLQVSGKVDLLAEEGETDFIHDFELNISSLSNNEAKRENISFTAHFPDQSEISAQGVMAVSPTRSKIDLKFVDVAADTLQHFTETPLNKNVEATVSGEVLYHYPEKSFSGDIRFARGRLLSENGMDLMSWQDAILSGFSYTDSPRHLEVAKLTLESPRISYTDSGEHYYSVLRKTINSLLADEQEQSEVSFSRLNIARVIIQDGAIDYLDERLSPPWQTKVAAIGGYVDNLHLSESLDPIEYGVTGTIAGAPFSAQGTLLPSSEPPVEKSLVELEDFPLQTLHQQLETAFELEMTNSTLNMFYKNDTSENSQVRLDISSLAAENQQSSTALALALLSDGKDRLSETVPLGDTSKPLFRQVVSHFQRLFIKASVSPYLLLKEPYDILQENPKISFTPGETQLSKEGLSNLSLYGMLLGDTPQLRLVLSATVDRISDTSGLRQRLEQAEKERVNLENARLLQEWQDRQDSGSSAAPTQDGIIVEDISEEDLQEFTPVSVQPIVITDEMLKQLGRDRIREVRDFLLEYQDVSPENIDISDNVTLSDTAEVPSVDISLSHIGN